MNETQRQILAAELALPQYASISDHEAAAHLNERNILHPLARVGIPELKNLTMTIPMLYQDGKQANLWYIIKKKAEQDVVPFVILWHLFNDPDFRSVDFFSEGIQYTMLMAGVDNLVADSTLIFPASYKTDLMTRILQLVPRLTQAELLGLPPIEPYQVSQARTLEVS